MEYPETYNFAQSYTIFSREFSSSTGNTGVFLFRTKIWKTIEYPNTKNCSQGYAIIP
jgi:hypothetical protein